MTEPSPRASRFAIATAALVLSGLAIGSFMLGRRTAEPPPAGAPAIVAAPSAPAAPAPVVLAPSQPLGRADLVAAVAGAADAFAAGQQRPARVIELAGREFELRLPFGCPGSPLPSPDGLTAAYDAVAKALRLRAQPAGWLPQEWLPVPAGEPTPAVETIEGFWMARAWTSSEACPPTPAVSASQAVAAAPEAGPEAATATTAKAPATAAVRQIAAEQTLGLAQFFTSADSRVGRRDGKAYNAVERIPPEALKLGEGLRLRLRGKIAQRADVPPVMCRATDGGRPACLVAVEFDEISVENPATGAILVTWDVSSHSASRLEGAN